MAIKGDEWRGVGCGCSSSTASHYGPGSRPLFASLKQTDSRWGTRFQFVEEPAEWEPISETSRWIRVEVASDFPKAYRNLEEKIVKNTENFIPKAQQALAKMMVALGEI
jgi:hypothetical protein